MPPGLSTLDATETDERELAGPGAADARPTDMRQGGRSTAALVRLEASERRRAVRDLRRATAEGGFSLSFTPCHALLSQAGAPAGLRGAEASLRWPRRLGISSAGGLLPLIASSGLTAEVGAWLVQAACEAAQRWPERAVPCIVSLDVPAACLADASLLTHVSDALEMTGLAPERLEIEIAEQTLADGGADVLLALSALCDLGVGIALDCFGSGSASLLTLKHLPLTTVKLDRSLIRELPRDWSAEALVAAAIDCSHALEAGVVAIGVETEAQRDLLARLGCDYAQGALYGPALTAERLAAALG
jgi:EAL domain-containing protein (putative c-di-GMP-specific phosphodiesterase class I)